MTTFPTEDLLNELTDLDQPAEPVLTIDEAADLMLAALPAGLDPDILKGAIGRVVQRNYREVEDDDSGAVEGAICKLVASVLPENIRLSTVLDGLAVMVGTMLSNAANPTRELPAYIATIGRIGAIFRKSIMVDNAAAGLPPETRTEDLTRFLDKLVPAMKKYIEQIRKEEEGASQG